MNRPPKVRIKSDDKGAVFALKLIFVLRIEVLLQNRAVPVIARRFAGLLPEGAYKAGQVYISDALSDLINGQI